MKDPGVKNLINTVAGGNSAGIRYVSGISEGHTAYVASEIVKETKGQLLIAASSYDKAKQLEEYLSFFAAEKKIPFQQV